MFIRRHKGATAVGALGIIIILAHLALAVAFGLTASQWLGGVAIGLILAVAAALHILLAAHRGDPDTRPPGQPTH